MIPSVGRIVHYTMDEVRCYAAVIAGVDTRTIDGKKVTVCVLQVFPTVNHGSELRRDVREGVQANDGSWPTGTWHEPEKVS